MYDEVKFWKTFRMARPLFNEIITAVINHAPFFRNNIDCTEKEGIFRLLKCTSSIRQLAYDVHSEFLDEYIQISERTSRTALDHFCQAVMQIYGPEFLRKPTVTDVEKLYLHHEEKHDFPRMLGSLDCTDWEWFGCSYTFKAQYVRRYHGPNPFIFLEAVAPQDLWIWHAFFGVAGSNNDINILYQSPLFNDLKTGRASKISFVANGVSYRSGYYLVDGIYPELASLVKTIPGSADDDHKRILYKQKHESARKNIKRAFGVLKKKWAILANPTRALKKERIINMMYICIILHNMIRKFKKYAISPKWFPEEAHQPNDPFRNEEQVQRVMNGKKETGGKQETTIDVKAENTAKGMIFQTLPQDMLMQVAKYTTARKMKPNESANEFAGKLSSIQAKFKSLRVTLKDKVLVRKLLNSVPKKFLPIVASIEQYQEIDTMQFEKAVGRITAFEE
uniref:Protein ALP1-like n=1 Tax=Tanacetum cinerariifolium TaxID=118510 RepID=A0A6L2KRK0_TANCI|nr:protein ALP1-like [Tanacetum cinerariifolium]